MTEDEEMDRLERYIILLMDVPNPAEDEELQQLHAELAPFWAKCEEEDVQAAKRRTRRGR